MFFFPESPRHLVATDRDDEALAVLKKLHFDGNNGSYFAGFRMRNTDNHQETGSSKNSTRSNKQSTLKRLLLHQVGQSCSLNLNGELD